MVKRWPCLVLIPALLLVAVLSPATTQAATVYRSAGRSVSADFITETDSSGCVVTQFSVSAFEAQIHNPPGPKTSLSAVGAAYSKVDTCGTGIVWQLSGGKELAPGEFTISSNLDRATLKATFPICTMPSKSPQITEVSGGPGNGTCSTVSLDLTWRGDSRRTHKPKDVIHIRTPTCTMNGHFMGSVRSAVASGSVSLGTQSLIAGSTTSAMFMYDRNVSVVVEGECLSNGGGGIAK